MVSAPQFSFSVSVAVISALVSVFQWRGAQKIERANKIHDLLGLIRTDESIHAVLQMIDYDEDWYDDDFHNEIKDNLERQVDRTFSYFSYICYLRKRRILTSGEFKFFEYDLKRILQNRSSVDYLYNIWHFSISDNSTCPFLYLCEYGRKKKILDNDFDDPEACDHQQESNEIKYHRYLNY